MNHCLAQSHDWHALRTTTHRGEQGQAIVEFALVMPVLILLLMGVVFFAMAFNLQMVLNAAAREGARAWANNRADSNPCCDTCPPPTCDPEQGENGFKKNVIPIVRKYITDNGYDGDGVIFSLVQVKPLEVSGTDWNQIQDSAEDAIKVKLVITYGIRLPTSNLNFITLRATSTFKRGS
ncbi:MAG: TadE family protein [Blastocatellia bacterium]